MVKLGISQKFLLLLCAIIALGSCKEETIELPGTHTMRLWYDEPAEYFINALPLGNGRVGAMLYGRPAEELIHLNEGSFWSGGPVTLSPNPEAHKFLPQVRKALDEKNYAEADKLIRNMQGLFSQSYAPIGDLLVKQKFDGTVTGYSRDLNLEDATATTCFTANDVTYTREAFVSHPDQALIIRFTASRPGALELNFSTQTKMHAAASVEGHDLVLSGRAPSHADPTYINTSDTPVQWDDPCKGMRFQTRIRTLKNDGNEVVENCRIHIDVAS